MQCDFFLKVIVILEDEPLYFVGSEGHWAITKPKFPAQEKLLNKIMTSVIWWKKKKKTENKFILLCCILLGHLNVRESLGYSSGLQICVINQLSDSACIRS